MGSQLLKTFTAGLPTVHPGSGAARGTSRAASPVHGANDTYLWQSEGQYVKRFIPAVFAGTLAAGALLGLSSVPASAAGALGSLDPTFGTNGIVQTNLGLNSSGTQIEGNVSAAIQLSNGDIVVAGSFGIVRYLPNGTLDTTFGTDGIATPPFPSFSDFPNALAVQPNGQILWGGEGTEPSGTEDPFAIVRFNANGSLDTTFGTDGVADAEFAGVGALGPDALLVEPDGKILAAGEALLQSYHGGVEGIMARFNANGTIDTAFGTDGQVTDLSAGNISTVGEDANGDIFALPAHVEFSASGQLDSTLTPEPITISSQGGDDVFESNGEYVIASVVGIVKHDYDVEAQLFNANGSLAASSGPFNYSDTTAIGIREDGVTAVAVQPNGQIVLTGGQYNYSTSLIGLARVDANGSLDSTFGSGGTVLTEITGNDSASAVFIEPSGDILVVGSSGTPAGITDITLARYLG
jgi:uncharacterized delta-60 repeat protein